MLDRRQILVGVAVLMGGSLLPSTVKALHGSEDIKSTNPATLSDRQLKAMTVMADIIIPETETAGASGAGVPAFIGMALNNWMLRDEREAFLRAFDDFLASAPDFLNTSPSEQARLVGEIDRQLHGLPKEFRFYRQFKELVLVGYYTSEVGGTEELEYDPVPGGYTVIKVTSETRTWST